MFLGGWQPLYGPESEVHFLQKGIQKGEGKVPGWSNKVAGRSWTPKKKVIDQ